LKKGSDHVAKRKLRDPGEFATLESVLKDDGVWEEVSARAIKRVIAVSLQRAMEENCLSKVAMAERMNTSRRQLDRVLDPDSHENIGIETLARAAEAVGRKLKFELI
jgi:antitoxin HicB